MSRLAAIVLAAGHGTRMRSKLVKVLHPVCGRQLTHRVDVIGQVASRQHHQRLRGQPERIAERDPDSPLSDI